jgi:hypothetical protein
MPSHIYSLMFILERLSFRQMRTDSQLRKLRQYVRLPLVRIPKQPHHFKLGGRGIGFKSVLMVSSKVYINSGPFSSVFEHRPGDSGLSMITPVYCEHEEPLTRITSTLLNKLDREELKNQFRDLPGTILLFLQKPKRITINEYDVAGTLSESVTYNRNSGN